MGFLLLVVMKGDYFEILPKCVKEKYRGEMTPGKLKSSRPVGFLVAWDKMWHCAGMG